MRICLTPSETALLRASVSSVTASAIDDPDAFSAQVAQACVPAGVPACVPGRVPACVPAGVPGRVREALVEFGERGSPSGTILISGFPVERVPPTPPSNSDFLGAASELARVQAAFNQVAGDMVAYEAEGGGKMFQDMVPCRSLTDSQTSLGSSVVLEIHTEQAFSDLRPDVLSLACLRGDPAAQTYTMHVRELLDRTTEEERATLRRPLWTVGVDASFVSSGLVDASVRGPVPILSGPEDDPVLVFDQDLMRGVTPEAEALRSKIVEIYEARKVALTLSPGDVLLVDNRRAVHGRSAFRARFDGSDRFVVRSFVFRAGRELPSCHAAMMLDGGVRVFYRQNG